MITVYLDIRNGRITNFEEQERDIQSKLGHANAIYIYRSSRNRKIYIGQTVHFITRHSEHYSGSEEKFNNAHFNKVVVVFDRYLNGSALDDVESQLITYFNADNDRGVDYDENEVINRNNGNNVNDYVEREEIASRVVLPLWQELYANGWVSTPTIDELRNNELFKYSPIKTLTNQQEELINEIIDNPNKNYVINGDAGTGKTVLLTNLAARILSEKHDYRIGVVVQPNWLDTGVKIFKVFGMNSTRLVVATSTQIINSRDRFDIVIVDEAHKLSRRGNKQMAAFNDVYNISNFSDCQSHLEILQRISSQVVLMYDILQAIRPANISRHKFSNLTQNYEKKFLNTQFRIQAQAGHTYTSDDYINGIKYLLYKDTGLLNENLTNFNPNFNRDVFKDRSLSAYFGYYENQPLHNLFNWIERDRDLNPEHINRVLSGLVEPWRQKEGKDSTKYHFFEGDLKCRWNWTQSNWIHSKDNNVDYKRDAEEQIGSIFAVQGNDLNKVGVLIGKDLGVDENNHLFGDASNFYNVNGTFTAEEMEVLENKKEFTLFILNMYYVLMTRGIDGIRLGFWHNEQFQQYLEETLGIND